VTRKRVVKHPGAAWAAAVVGAWLAAAACRTMQRDVLPSPAGLAAPAFAASTAVPPPSIRVGVLPSVERASIGARSGVVVHGRAPGESAVLVRSLPRATFEPSAEGRVRLVETGDGLDLATVSPAAPSELLQAEEAVYRGLLEVRPAEEGKVRVVNVVNLEDYLRGVVPNELSPQAFPQIEALKAQAVAARTYALAHLGDYASKGYDVCATPACQVYRGQGSEHRLTDRAVEETRGVVATWRGRPIRAYYTSTCGGHTEEGGAIFDDDAPYLRGVACLPERASRHTVRTAAVPPPGVPGQAARDVALLEALGVVSGAEADPERLHGAASEAEVGDWTSRLQGVLRPGGEGLAAPSAAGAPSRAQVFARLAGALEKSGGPAIADGEVAGLAEGTLSVLHGEAADSHPLDPAVRLFRDLDGAHEAVSELGLSVGDRVVYVERDGRVVYLEAERTAHGATGDYASRHYRWEARLSPADVARSLARYGSVGKVRDIVPKRLGVSGRVVELGVVGSEGELDLKGLQVRWGLGLRENLFVIERETGPRGDVKRFVIAGKGWGHGVGLCQVGAFGMAQAGSTFEEILKHYYTGIRLSPLEAVPSPAGGRTGRPATVALGARPADQG
jgi:stage II sporulation protein D